MIKTNNERTMGRRTYVTPNVKAFEVNVRSAILNDSKDYGDANEAGGIMQESTELNW